MNKENIFKTKIEFIKGVGPKRASVLNKELNLFTFSDVLKYFPYRYEDRTVFLKIKEIYPSLGNVSFVGKIVSTNSKSLAFKIDSSIYSLTLGNSSQY